MGVSGQRHALAALYPPGKGPPVPIEQEAGWAPEPVWMQRLEEKSSASVGDWTPVVQSVVRHYTDWATPAHKYLYVDTYLWLCIVLHPFHKAKFCGVPSCVFDKLGCAVGEGKLRNTALETLL
jgi:hypothetical protein